MSTGKLSLASVFQNIKAPWQPALVANLNQTVDVKVARLQGAFVWHAHPDTDELFYVLEGGPLELKIRDGEQGERSVLLEKGELFVVPRGVEHLPMAEREIQVMLIEAAGTANTGDREGESDRTYVPDDVRA